MATQTKSHACKKTGGEQSLQQDAIRACLAENMFDTVREPLLVLDSSLCVQKANAAFYSAFQLAPHSIENQLIYKIDQRRWDRPELRQLFEGTLPMRAESRDIPIDFEIGGLGRRNILMNVRRTQHANPRLRSFLLALEDVTERKQAGEMLSKHLAEVQHSNAELDQFAYVASHDLQEPLRMVASFSELLAKRYSDKLDSDAKEFIGFAVDGVHRMQAMINDLLVYSRVGRRDLIFTPVDCEGVLETVLAALRATVDECGADIAHGPLPVITADAMQMGQLFQQLVGNALKFRADRPCRIRIWGRKYKNQWLFSVADNGIGMKPDESKRIFQVFQRLHPRDVYPGTGIGLAICKKIVERHGGRIWVESRAGQGAIFYFTISQLPPRKETGIDRTSPPH
jgi:signal transduction histidine kinase